MENHPRPVVSRNPEHGSAAAAQNAAGPESPRRRAAAKERAHPARMWKAAKMFRRCASEPKSARDAAQESQVPG